MLQDQKYGKIVFILNEKKFYGNLGSQEYAPRHDDLSDLKISYKIKAF